MQNNQVKGLRKLRLEYAAVPVGLIVLWELAAVAQLVDQRFVPAPHRVVQTLYVWIAGDGAGGAGPYVGTWLTAVGASTMRVMVGFLVAALAGTALGLLIGWFRAPRVLFQPLIDLLRPIPITAWVPFTVVIFGIKIGRAHV